MSHKKSGRSLHEQAHARMRSMLSPGDSKHADRLTGADREKIYSYDTYKSYKKTVNSFCKWVKDTYPDTTSLAKARDFVPEYLDEREEKGLSAWTLSLDAAALSKLYGITPDDPDRWEPPKRHREDITRSRGEAARDSHFSTRNHAELIAFCKATGPRRSALERLTGEDYYTREEAEEEAEIARDEGDSSRAEVFELALDTFPDQDAFVLFEGDKGGLSRLSPIIGEAKEAVIARFEGTQEGRPVWEHVPDRADIHSYRADYATSLYKTYAATPDQLDPRDRITTVKGEERSAVYCCRGDERGKRLDYAAAEKVSIALGHKRVDTAVTNYIRNI